VIARVRLLWRLTSTWERVVTVLSPVLPILALLNGRWTEAAAWTVAAFWWSLYLDALVDVDRLKTDLRLRLYLNDVLVRTVYRIRKEQHVAEKRTSAVHVPRAHR
jgi:hypothetical protein